MVSAPVVLPEAYKDSTGCKNTAIRGVSKVSNLSSEAVSINRSSCSIQVCPFTSLRSAGQFRHIQAICLFSWNDTNYRMLCRAWHVESEICAVKLSAPRRLGKRLRSAKYGIDTADC